MTYTLDWSETNLGGSAVVSYARGAVLDFTDKPVGATAALSLTANHGNSANVTIAEFSIQTSGSSVMTFAYHTSSESGYDKLHIDVDGVSQADYSGTTAWTTHAGIGIPSAGVHAIRFRYQKDGSGDLDQDRVWIALLNITNTVTTNDASGSVTTYDMEDGAIPSVVTTSTWTNSTSAPIAGTRSLRTPASPANSGSYDLTIAKAAGSEYRAVTFDWKVSSENNYDFLFIFPDSTAANVPASGAPSSAASPGWLAFDDTASGRLGLILPSAASTILLRYAKDAGGAAGSDAAWLDNLALPASSGTAYDKTPADAEGITDARTVVQQAARTQGDSAGITDARSVMQAQTRTPSDAVGATDSAATTQGFARTQPDPVGITDSVTADFTGSVTRTPGDAVGLTDAVAVALTLDRTPADTLAITDTDNPLVLEITEGVDDPVGLTDSVTVVRAVAATTADALGITDSTAAAGEGDTTATPADDVPLSDAAASVLDSIRTPADLLALVDTVTASSTAAHGPSDAAPISDSVVAVMERVVTVADSLPLTDLAGSFVGALVTPPARTVVVPAENRTVVVPSENRTVVVPSENRTLEA